MLKHIVAIALIILLCSCNDKVVYTDFVALNNGIWKKEDTVAFAFKELDTLKPHHLFLNVRNDNRYQFSNLFLIVAMEAPSGNTRVDTLEYDMALPSGDWLGQGVGSVKESKLWYKENVILDEFGVYKINVLHAMRKNGEVNGLESLEGITDVGFQIEKEQE